MSNGLGINTEQIRAHAREVDGFADRANTAAEAAAHVTSLDDAYGVFCQPFGQMVKEPQERGTESLRKTANGIKKIADELRKVADSAQENEDRISTNLQRILQEMDGMSPRRTR